MKLGVEFLIVRSYRRLWYCLPVYLIIGGCGQSLPNKTTGNVAVTTQAMTRDFPMVHDTATGLIINNVADVPIINVHVVVDVETPNQNRAREYSRDISQIQPKSQVSVPYSSLKSKTGQDLVLGKLIPTEYHFKFGDDAFGGSVMGTPLNAAAERVIAELNVILRGNKFTED